MEDRDLTDAAEILACARAQGVAVSLNGDRIVLEGYRPRPTWLVSVVSESKAEIVAELRRTVGGGWPWLFEERVSHVMRLRNLPRVEAERVAYEMVLVEFLNRNCADTPSDRCAWCGTRDARLHPAADRSGRTPFMAAQLLLGGMAGGPPRRGDRHARRDGNHGAELVKETGGTGRRQ